MSKKYPIRMIHKECGKVALLTNRIPVKNETILSSNFSHVDGTPIKPFDQMTCDSCKKQLYFFSDNFIFESE